MPKIIDHEKQKIEIAEATWDVIIEEGLQNASVRKIAKVAGISVGSLRHYFSTQSELLLFSMKLVSDRVKQRIAQRGYTNYSLEVLEEVLSQFLPFDEERRIEMEVWLIFNANALVDSKLKNLSTNVYDEMHQCIQNFVNGLIKLQYTKENLDMELEIHRLHALIDGMAMHHLLYPDKFNKEQMTNILTCHLRSICKNSRGNSR
ncbi:TetR/AcrR family transcriptional regulator [Clostridium sp. JS66]|uniref:TetR/AcrR family transcriptional regulator n=1 Tax=Clostridium sp. JS66 TaxID=3064705 RepID=UPI00298DC883|nr:TetR/AcrR family transcriptional regulator [Clostridium sp. JS66]WPC43441.1 TetR/AcrR family transcriptional regulator [Clostridium sp. JS66]